MSLQINSWRHGTGVSRLVDTKSRFKQQIIKYDRLDIEKQRKPSETPRPISSVIERRGEKSIAYRQCRKTTLCLQAISLPQKDARERPLARLQNLMPAVNNQLGYRRVDSQSALTKKYQT